MKKKIILLTLLCFLVISIFLFLGLSEKNIGYYLPRRLIKICAVLLISYCISYSCVTFQTITNNRILTPSVIGLDSLYLFIQTVIVFFFGSKQLSMLTGYPNFALSIFVMVGAAWILFFLLFKGDGKSLYFLVLAGMIVGGLFQSMSTFMQVLLDPNEFTVLEGTMFASLNRINDDLLVISIIIVLLTFIVTYKDYPHLDTISLGQNHAINLGVPYKKVVRKNLMVTAILVSVSTALAGPITFLGILVVSLARSYLPTYRHSVRILGSTLFGSLFLVFGLLLVERVFRFQTTISVIINFIGGVYFIYLILKESKTTS